VAPSVCRCDVATSIARTSESEAMPPDDRLRLDDNYGVQNIRCDPIEAGKNQTIESIESEPLRRVPLQHIELVAQRHIDFATASTLICQVVVAAPEWGFSR
jgi:hypothetical protein